MDPMPGGTPTLVDPMASGPGSSPPATAKVNRGRGRGVLLWPLAAAVVLIASVAVGEWAAKTQEMNRLVGGIGESEAAMTQAMTAVSLLLGPAGALGDTDAADAQKQLQRAATTGLAGVKDAADQIEAVPIQPWHHDVLAARDAYLAHNTAWQDFLTSAAGDPSVWLTPDEEVESTWDALAPVLTDAVPTPAILDLDQRVAGILEDGAPAVDDTGGGGTIEA
jgi:hypothetical protein